MKLTDKILASRRGDAASALAYLDRPDAKDAAYVDALWRWCGIAGVDFAIAFAWACVETADFTSTRWRRDLNPAGIAIPADSTVQPFVIPDGDAAARLHVQCLFAIVARATHADVPLWPEALNWMLRVWLPKVTDPRFHRVERLTDLDIRYVNSKGTASASWAWGFQEGQPAQAAIAKAQRVWPDLPNQQEDTDMAIPTTHSVPRPTIYNLATDYARFGLSQGQASEIIGSRFPNRNGGTPRFIVYHIQVGSTRGSLGWWARGDVDASSTVMIQKDGSILRIVPEKDGPWTNGDVKQPTAQANGILAMGGNPNNWSLTIELEGHPGEPLNAAMLNALIWQSEDWIMRYPDILKANWCLLRHGHINSIDKARCGIYNDPVIAALNEWLDSAGVPPTPEPEPEPIQPPPLYPPGMSFELAREFYEAGGKFTASWTSKEIGFDPTRSECQYWLARGKLRLKDGERYNALGAQWPHLVKITRRGKTKNVHVYQYSNGDVYEKVIRKDP